VIVRGEHGRVFAEMCAMVVELNGKGCRCIPWTGGSVKEGFLRGFDDDLDYYIKAEVRVVNQGLFKTGDAVEAKVMKKHGGGAINTGRVVGVRYDRDLGGVQAYAFIDLKAFVGSVEKLRRTGVKTQASSQTEAWVEARIGVVDVLFKIMI